MKFKIFFTINCFLVFISFIFCFSEITFVNKAKVNITLLFSCFRNPQISSHFLLNEEVCQICENNFDIMGIQLYGIGNEKILTFENTGFIDGETYFVETEIEKNGDEITIKLVLKSEDGYDKVVKIKRLYSD